MRLFPWFNEEEDRMKEKRTNAAVKRGQEVEQRIRELAQTYRATGIILQKTYPPK